MRVVRRLRALLEALVDILRSLIDLLWITMIMNATKSSDVANTPMYTIVAWILGLTHWFWWELRLTYWELRLFYGFGDPFWFDLNRGHRSKPASPSKTRSTV